MYIRQLDVINTYNSIRTSNARTLCVTYMEEVHTYVGSDVGNVNVHPGITIIRTRKNIVSQQAVKMLRTSVRLQQ